MGVEFEPFRSSTSIPVNTGGVQLSVSQRAVLSALDSSVVDVVSSPLAGRESRFEHSITLRARGDVDPRALFESLNGILLGKKARIVSQIILAGCDLHASIIEALRDVFGGIPWPITWIGGPSGSFSGTQVQAVSGVTVTPVRLNGAVVGNCYQDDAAHYCVLGGLRPADLTASRYDQTTDVFRQMQTVLGNSGMNFSNVARTWLFLDNILDWYDDLNAARTSFFAELGVTNRSMPASTGIGAPNPYGAALVAGTLAVKSKGNGLEMFPVASPLQCAAVDYKSAFSRAMEVSHSAGRRLYISGTASIHPDGRTAHVDDVPEQIRLTMDVVQAILESRLMTWSDVTRAIAYVPDLASVDLLEQYCAERGLPPFPLVVTQADVCRADLLYEIELDAGV
jgi:enamine deaminase RidA (YjgF/YER057c/UK114 family)